MYAKSRYSYVESVVPDRIMTRQTEKIIFTPPTPKTDKFAKSIAYIGPTTWNALSSEEQFTEDPVAFKNKIKIRLLNAESETYTQNQ